jgi:hypothetical protein
MWLPSMGAYTPFDGKPPVPGSTPGTCQPLLTNPVSTSLLLGESAINCGGFGGKGCTTIAQEISIVSTPVIQITGSNPTIGRIYVVVQSQSGTTFNHRIWSLDISSLSVSTAVHNTVTIPTGPTGCPIGQGGAFSKTHIQRPALLIGGDNYLYVAFSMMDGINHPLPNGMILAYNLSSFAANEIPLCMATSAGNTNADGGGVWQGGAGPAYGPDSSATTNYVYFNTGNGVYDGLSNWGDSFIEMTTAGSGSLKVNGSFTPVDQLSRSGGADNNGITCTPDDIDYGSGGVMLIPEENVKYPYLAVGGEKTGGIFFNDRTAPSGYNGDGTCLGTGKGGNKNVQTHAINGTSFSDYGPVIHTSPAFWENSPQTTATNYLFIGSQVSYDQNKQKIAGSGRLMRYQICQANQPIQNSSNPKCTTAGAYAYDPVTGEIDFPWGATPTITQSPTDSTDAIIWAIWADGTVVPSLDQFTYMGNNFPIAQNGILYAFDAANATDPNMKKLYSSNDCAADQIDPAAKYSVPNIVNGYVYLGTQGPPALHTSNGAFPNNLDFNHGMFYIFGHFPSGRTC